MNLIALAPIVGVGAVGIGFLAGKGTDLYFRTKLLRNVLKKDYAMLHVLDKQHQTIKIFMISLEESLVRVKGKTWAVKRRYIHRLDKQELGFHASEEHVKWVDGVPCLFVDSEHIRPVTFYPDKNEVSPTELNSWMVGWENNARGKAGKSPDQFRMLVIACLGVSALAMGLSFMNYMSIGGLTAAVEALADKIPEFAEDVTLIVAPKG